VVSKARVKLRDAWTSATAPLHAWPSFVIIGAQRSGTSSLYQWLCTHPAVLPTADPEVHYFDDSYGRGRRWYRAQFPLRAPGRTTGESTPFMLFHPLAPGRVVRDLPDTTKFIVVLRDPVQRALSHYWYTRARGLEDEPLARALDLEKARTRGEMQRLLDGEPSPALHRFSYVARGEYAPQLRRWFDTVGSQRVLVLESERLFSQQSQRDVTDFLRLPAHPTSFPWANQAARTDGRDPEDVVARLREHFAPYNGELFELLGSTMWAG
jgi:hypothetical protein